MTLTARLLMLVAAALCFGVQAVYFTHMLQLNSYRDERYRKWYGEHTATVVNWRRLLPAAVLAVALFPLDDALTYGIAAGIFLLTALLNWPQKAKKPLVVTARVRRLFLTEALLLALLFAISWLLGGWRGLFLLALLSTIVWFWVRLANLSNQPIEKKIADSYVRDAAGRLRDMPGLTVIGITGSYGKTSTKMFLHALLSAKFNVLMTPESYNTTMGVVRTIREQLKPSHQVFIAEMGAKNVGDIREICDLVHPRYGVLTSIGEQHLETFGSIDNIIRTKFELVDALPPDGIAFLNTDNDYIRTRETDKRIVSYGLQQADYTASDISVDAGGTSFTVTAPDGESRRFTTKLLGAHILQNLTGCIAVAHTLGIPLEQLVYPVRMLKPVPHRLQLLPNGYIDDAYNSNPAGFRAALDVLSGFSSQRVLVTPGMVELGNRQDALNRELGVYAAGRCDYAVLIGERQAPPLKEGLLEGGFSPERIFVAHTLQEGLAHLHSLPTEGGRTVLLENDLPDNF